MGQISGVCHGSTQKPFNRVVTGRPHSADSDLVNNIEQMPQNRPHTQGPTASADSERFEAKDFCQNAAK